MALSIPDLQFDRPSDLQAIAPAEERGLARDEVRLLVSDGEDHTHFQFRDIATALEPGDLLVVNESATLPASLPATGPPGQFLVNCSTNYGNAWLVEPRWSESEPGPLALSTGDRITAEGVPGRIVGEHLSIPRLVFVRFEGDVRAAMDEVGQPIRYGYVDSAYSLDTYQTYFATTPGSAEMPSAARPFTHRVLESLRARGVGIAAITLHTGVSSLEVTSEDGNHSGIERTPLYPEPFRVPTATARAVARTNARGGRVIAVGTTVVRALESAWDDTQEQVKSTEGFTQLFITPERGVRAVDGLLTGLHDPQTTHLAMLYAVADRETIMSGYREAIAEAYLWHEFGDTHLLLPGT
jgi:S-adenosylmethionine:tRNA ribosyltransferase-isomerase